jgi:hypothetical protein
MMERTDTNTMALEAAQKRGGKVSTLKKLKWATTGKQKAVDALEELRKFVDELFRLVPVNDPDYITTGPSTGSPDNETSRIIDLDDESPVLLPSWENVEGISQALDIHHEQLLLEIASLQKQRDLYRKMAHQRIPRNFAARARTRRRPLKPMGIEKANEKRNLEDLKLVSLRPLMNVSIGTCVNTATVALSKTDNMMDHLEEALARQMVDAVHAARLCCGHAALPCGPNVFFFLT